MTRLTSEILDRLKRKDNEATREVLSWLYERFYSRACITCSRCFLLDPQSSEQVAADALYVVFDEVDSFVRTGKLLWQGEDRFVSWVWRRLYWRLLDAHRRMIGESHRVLSLFAPVAVGNGEREVTLGDILTTDSDAGPDAVISQESIAFDLEVLFTLLERLSGTALAETLDAMIGYIRVELRHALGRFAGFHGDEDPMWLVEQCKDLTGFQPTREDMYAFIQAQLCVERSVLYQRIFDLRKALRFLFGGRDRC